MADHALCQGPAGPWCDQLVDVTLPRGSILRGFVVGSNGRIGYRPSLGVGATALRYCPFCGASLAVVAAAEGASHVR